MTNRNGVFAIEDPSQNNGRDWVLSLTSKGLLRWDFNLWPLINSVFLECVWWQWWLKKRTCADAVLSAGDGEPRLTGAVCRSLDLTTPGLAEERGRVGLREGGGFAIRGRVHYVHKNCRENPISRAGKVSGVHQRQSSDFSMKPGLCSTHLNAHAKSV